MELKNRIQIDVHLAVTNDRSALEHRDDKRGTEETACHGSDWSRATSWLHADTDADGSGTEIILVAALDKTGASLVYIPTDRKHQVQRFSLDLGTKCGVEELNNISPCS